MSPPHPNLLPPGEKGYGCGPSRASGRTGVGAFPPHPNLLPSGEKGYGCGPSRASGRTGVGDFPLILTFSHQGRRDTGAPSRASGQAPSRASGRTGVGDFPPHPNLLSPGEKGYGAALREPQGERGWGAGFFRFLYHSVPFRTIFGELGLGWRIGFLVVGIRSIRY